MIILINDTLDEIRNFINTNSLRNDLETIEVSFNEQDGAFYISPKNDKQELEIKRIANKYNAHII